MVTLGDVESRLFHSEAGKISMRYSTQNVNDLLAQYWPKIASLFTILVGSLVLAGWGFNIAILKSIFFGMTFIKANTALAFLAAGINVWLLQTKYARPGLFYVRRACTILIILIGALTLSEYIFGWDLGIDQLFFKETSLAGNLYPGRMSPVTAINFVLLGSALAFIDFFKRYRAAQFLTFVANFLALLAVIGYIYTVDSLYRIASFTSIALPTALTFLILCQGILFLKPDEGWMAILTSNRAVGILTRRMILPAIILPILLGYLGLPGQIGALLGDRLYLAFFAVSIIIVFSLLLTWSADSLNRVDLDRQQTELKMQQLNAELEGRVAERTAQLLAANQLLEQDVTRRELTEATLTQERDQMQALMDNIPDTIYFKDTASRFTRINRAEARVLGLSSSDQAIGKTDADFHDPQVVPGFLADEQQLFKTGQPIINNQEFNPTPDGQPRWFSSTKIPEFDHRGRVIGLMGVSHDITERIKSEEALRGVNIQLTRRIRNMSVLHELQEQLQACVSFDEIYQVTAQLVSQLFPAESGALYIINNSQNLVETSAVWGMPPMEHQVFKLEDCWALRMGQIYMSDKIHTNPACVHLKKPQPVYSVCIPMLAQGEVLGVLHLRSAPDSEIRIFEEAQQQLARVATDGVALGLANLALREKLRQQSIRDPLTDLFNRRFMEESLERELLRSARSKKPVGIIMMDIDLFKQFNDAHGHDAGDAVLRQLGHFLRAHSRGSDVACRFGGEEFILILPEATLENTRIRAERYCQDFRSLQIEHAGHSLGALTMSIGVAAYPEHGSLSSEVLKSVDLALYRAKQNGRDQVAVAG
jgi:diguanylate cyclase (GGDEF)-like protein/PAS domain S-box-containing protein